MSSIEPNLNNVGYGLAAVVYVVLAILLLTRLRGRLRGGILTAAVFVTVVWSLIMVAGNIGVGLRPQQIFIAEIVHDAAWLAFLAALLSGAVGAARYWVVRYGGLILTLILIVISFLQELRLGDNPNGSGSGGTLVLGSLLTSLYALVLVEQIYRNARESQRNALKYLCLGIGGIFAYDLFLYSNAIFSGEIGEFYWSIRGFFVAMCAPLIAVAAQRSPAWSVGIFVSRQVVFHTATLFGAGIYLMAVGLAGYYVNEIGGEWGGAAQALLFSAALIGLSVLVFSDTLRARLRVIINKHFYENKYDYRQEWLQLIDTLTSVDETLPLKKRAIKALAQILNSPSGFLWLKSHDDDCYQAVSGWNATPSNTAIMTTAPVIEFLATTGWIIDIDEYRRDPSHYNDAQISFEDLQMSEAAYVIPLIHDSSLLGFVVLAQAIPASALNYEDRDLLKTAGLQIASYLAQEAATEKLAEGRQFEAFNRLTAFLMHDLKNVIAQQSLVVENAQRHKENPAFVDDAIQTIRGSVIRMKKVIDQLQQGPSDAPFQRVELGKLVLQAVSRCADREPPPRASIGDDAIWVRGDSDRLLMAVVHAIRNAQDATRAEGAVTVTLERSVEGRCSIKISDDGRGMDELFVRERLFRPFDSTKGTQGMGIGAYQIREAVRAVGGDVRVSSRLQAGTTICLDLPEASDESR